MVKIAKISAVRRQAHAERCHRCGGLMVSEPVHELASYDLRCVSCGERIDPVILAHRRQSGGRFESMTIGTGQGQLSLS